MSPRSHNYYVYIMASASNTLYIGMTNNLERRVAEHRANALPGFTAKYNVHRLVYMETTTDVRAAIAREKEVKAWRRSKKIALIESANPGWTDLASDWALEAV